MPLATIMYWFTMLEFATCLPTNRSFLSKTAWNFAAANQLGATDAPDLHHIATIYEGEENWASQFSDIFNEAGYDLEDDINKVMVDDHFGPHPAEYHQEVYDTLSKAVQGLSGPEYRSAFEQAMYTLRQRVVTPGDQLNIWLTN